MAAVGAASRSSFVTLLVVDYSVDYYLLFRNAKTADGRSIKVEQCEWKDLHVEGYYDGQKCVARCHLKAAENPWPFSTQKNDRVVTPDFVLIRNFPSDLHSKAKDIRQQLIGLVFAGLPAVNSLQSILSCCERPFVHAELHKAAQRVRQRLGGADKCTTSPVSLQYKSNQKIGTQAPPLFGLGGSEFNNNDSAQEAAFGAVTLPAVVKVASTHAGYGKIRVKNTTDRDDLKSILALHRDYYTVEPFLKIEFEYRIQKIGEHYRGFRRNSSSSWKNNTGNLEFVDHELTEEDKAWADECQKMFGGLDILAIDVLQLQDGSKVILEVNDTACGLMFEHEKEDLGHIRDLVLKRIDELVL